MRVLIAVLVLIFALAEHAVAQIGSGFTVGTRPAFALLGCNVVAQGDPEVVFAQISDGGIGRPFIGPDDFEGEDCADVLSAFLSSGFRILTSRPVLQSVGREIIVYDLIAE